MLVSTVLTTGQITFILRVVVQILSSGGLFLIGLIILGNAPRIASISTHDVINRVAGKQTTISTSLKWFFKRGKANDPTNTSRLAAGIALLISYTLVTKLTDVGLIGLRACQTAGTSYIDNPASIRTDEQALALVTGNMRKGSDPSMIQYFRCDSSQASQLDDNSTLFGCTSWRNSTYADKNIFEGLNLSDTAVLMPRQLARYDHDDSNGAELNSYFLGPLSRRIEEPTIMNGILVYPHEAGFRAFLGAPNLPPFTRTILPQTLALEVDVGCMTVGIYDTREITSVSQYTDTFFNIRNNTWRQYSGPDYLKDIISQTVDEVRNWTTPMWNMSTEYEGLVLGFNHSYNTLSTAASVRHVYLPDLPFANGSTFSDQYSLFRNCSTRLYEQLNLTGPLFKKISVPACSLMGLGGSIVNNGELFVGLSNMVCATAAQVNLVRADISVDGNGKVDLSFDRLPSDLNVIVADYWDIVRSGSGMGFNIHDSNYRYTLTPNADGQRIHYINAWEAGSLGDFDWGAGAGANSFSSIAGVVVQSKESYDERFSTLSYLKENVNVIKFEPSRVTKWAGEMGASYILGSTAFNGWAAASLQSGPLTVLSTGGKTATCYNPLYALAFVPLFLMAAVVALLSLEMLLSSTLLKARKMENSYGGLEPYTTAVFANRPPSDTLLIWENYDRPRLEPVQNGRTVQVGGNGTAVEYLHTDSGWKE